jgi:hypothetical protein
VPNGYSSLPFNPRNGIQHSQVGSSSVQNQNMTAFMHPWPQQPSPMHPSIHYMDQPLQHWLPTSLAPHQPMSQHSSGLGPLMHPIAHPPPLRPASQASIPSQQPSPAQSIPHSQSMSHPQQSLPQQLSLPPPDPNSLAQHSQRYNQPVPHQVVGQQGIRGVLPTATGDPSSPDETCEPEQDEKDGTWPCKCCGKRYRHAKHLRRHHSRHTGETPYECPLCARRFGRSDVLKRHYHKCATRRGQPVGDHLAGQRGHPRRQRGSVPGSGQSIGSPITSGSNDQQHSAPSHTLDGMNQNFIKYEN